jgi:hypothetical protein
MLFSADVMGYAEAAIEKKLGGGVAIFTNGAEGDVSPAEKGFAGAQKLGTLLAETVQGLWQNTATKETVQIHGTYSDLVAPDPLLNGCLAVPGTSKSLCEMIPGLQLALPFQGWMQKILPFSAIRFDDVVFAAVPGEPTTDVGLAIKQAGQDLGYRYTFVVGLANDYMGYVTTEAEYQRGEYEAQATLYGPKTGDYVVDSVVKQLVAVKHTP